MASLLDTAKNYEAPQTKNIAELEKVSVKVETYEKTFKEGTPDEFTLTLMKVDDEEYRIPASVLGTLKEISKVRPDIEFIKVTKTGTGLSTKYSVIPL